MGFEPKISAGERPQAAELADVPSFTVLKTQICVTRPQCVNTLALVYGFFFLFWWPGYGQGWPQNVALNKILVVLTAFHPLQLRNAAKCLA